VVEVVSPARDHRDVWADRWVVAAVRGAYDRAMARRSTDRPGPAPTTTETRPLHIVDTDGAEREGHYEEAVSTAAVDRRLLHGPFATHVWAGRYEITSLGGQGAQGATFLGNDRKTGQRVAVKLFDLGRAKDWKAHELFDREVATLQRLSHPGIPRFVDVVKDESTGARALVMGCVDGDSLADVIARDGVLPEKRLWTILFECAHVLAAVHGEGVVHRDLKPANLILRPDGRVAVVDFGGVGAFRGQAGSTVVGTFGYMAPEQLYGAQTPATDLYALGATVLHAATGKAPDEQPRDGLAIDVDAAAPFLSPPLRTLLARLLSPDPKSRPVDAAALLRELQGIGTQRTSTTATTTAATTSAKAREADEVVDAVWLDDEVRKAVSTTGDVLGFVASLVALLEVGGIGRFLVPLILTLVDVFVSDAKRRRFDVVREIVARRARTAQRQLKSTAAAPDDDAARDTRRRVERQRADDARRKTARKAERLHRRDGFWRL
jgi:hypothetical protein